MTKVAKKTKQNPKIVQTVLKDGRASLALEYYLGRDETPVLDENGHHLHYTSGAMAGKPRYRIRHTRKRETLNLYILLNPRTRRDRELNNETLQLAERIRFERAQELLEKREGYRLKRETDNDFIKYFSRHCDNELYTTSVRATFRSSYRRLLRFLESTPRYRCHARHLRIELITPEMVTGFTNYLKKVCRGEGAHKSYYMFRTVIRHAIEDGMIKKNPCQGIIVHRDTETLKKEILTLNEIKTLASTRYKREDTSVQRAFLFCCFTGLRWCDMIKLTYGNIDYAGRMLRFNQKKTEGRSAHSGVTIPLSDTLLNLIGNPSKSGDNNEIIFKIRCDRGTAANRLQRWVRKAGIFKKITWHCARHSFAVNVLGAGANIKTVAALMGHSSIKITEKYLHIVDRQKEEAINSLGPLEFEVNNP